MNGAAWIWIALAAGLMGGLLSSLQHALREVSRHSLEQSAIRRLFEIRARSTAQNGNGSNHPGAVTADAAGAEAPPAVQRVAADLDGHAVAVAVPRIACNLLVGVATVLWIAFVRIGQGAAPQLVDVAAGIVLAGVFTWTLSMVVPIALAMHAAERTLLSWLWLVRACHVVVGPLRFVLAFVSEVVRRLLGDQARDELEAREAELLSLVEESQREGHFDEEARDMIEAVVEFSSTSVEQIMTPRTEVEALEYTDDLDEVKRHAQQAGHSRIPVFREDIDHIEGVLYVKDFLRWLVADHEQGRPFVLKDVLREPTFVPETKTVRDLLKELLADQVHIAIALDEYGGCSGIVTIEDIVEEIFGEIQDEYEPEKPEVPPVVIDADQGLATIECRTDIDDANDGLAALGLELPEHDDYDTVGGFVVTTMGKIPDAGEQFVHNGLAVTVLEAEPTRVLKVSVRRAQEEEETAEEDAA